MDLVHKDIPCDVCGEKMPLSNLERHKNELCVHRKVQCKYCTVLIRHSNVVEHEAYCGTKSVVCDLCDKLIPRKRE